MARGIRKKPRCAAPVLTNNSLKISIPLTRLSPSIIKKLTKQKTLTKTTLGSSKENDSTNQEKVPVLKIKKSKIVDLPKLPTALYSDVELLLNFGNTAVYNTKNPLICEQEINIEKTKDTVNETFLKPTKTDATQTLSDVIVIDDVGDEIPATENKQKPLNNEVLEDLTGAKQNSVVQVSEQTLPKRHDEKNATGIKDTIHIEEKKNIETKDKATQTNPVLLFDQELVVEFFYDKLSKLSEISMSHKKSNTFDNNGENDLNNNNGGQSNLQNEVTITEIIDITAEPDNDVPEDLINKLVDQSERNKALIKKFCEPQQKNLQLQLENHQKLADIMITKLANKAFETVRENMKDSSVNPSQSKNIETQTESNFVSVPIQGPYDIANNNVMPTGYMHSLYLHSTLNNQQEYDPNKLEHHQVSALGQQQTFQYNRTMMAPLEVNHSCGGNWNPSMTTRPNYAYVEPTVPNRMPAFQQVSYANLSPQTGGGVHNHIQYKIQKNRKGRNAVRGPSASHATTGPTKQNNKYKLLMQQQKLREMAAQQRAWHIQSSNYPNAYWGNNCRPNI